MTPNEARAKLAEIIQEAGADISFGLFQQTVRFADEGDRTASPENVALIKRLYFDPVHATDVAAEKYKEWRYNPPVPAEQAWCAYNWPGSYSHYHDNPNLENYRRGLEQARQILGATNVPDGDATQPAPVYDPTAPIVPQNHPWDCAEQSTLWGMTAYGRHPADTWMEGRMLADGIVSVEQGLLDASGAGLAAWITDQYGEFGYSGHNNSRVSFDDVARLVGKEPVLIGGRAWNHWSGVRRYDAANDWLELANPADGWMGVRQTMNRQQFDALGPFSCVLIHWGGDQPPDHATDPSLPVEDVAALRAKVDDLEARLAALQADKDGLVVALADVDDRVGDLIDGYAEAIKSAVGQLRANREQFLGPRS